MSHRKNPLSETGGFTMIELVVVTAIIAVLASLLLPSLRQAKEKGKAADCANNLHQVYLAFAMHAADHVDDFPRTYTWQSFTETGKANWVDVWVNEPSQP